MLDATLIAQATNHLNRKQQLIAAGVPANNKSELAAWIKMATRANESEIAAAGKAVFHACTARVSNGVDADLPTIGGVGCRISFVPLRAEILSGEETSDSEAWENTPNEFGEVRWGIYWGSCGTGYMAPVFINAPAEAEPQEVVATHRKTMLKKDNFFASREEAELAVTKMLEARCAR